MEHQSKEKCPFCFAEFALKPLFQMTGKKVSLCQGPTRKELHYIIQLDKAPQSPWPKMGDIHPEVKCPDARCDQPIQLFETNKASSVRFYSCFEPDKHNGVLAIHAIEYK